MRKILLLTLFMGLVYCQNERPTLRPAQPEPAQLPFALSKSTVPTRARFDDRVRQYIYPERVLWQSENTALAQVTGAENLVNARESQVTLEQPPCCVMTNQGAAPGILLDFGIELQGSVQIMVGMAAVNKPARFRVRFGESASEAMSEIGGPKNATNDHAVRDLMIEAPWLGTVEFGNTGFRFVRIDLEEKNRTLPVVGVRAVLLYRDLDYRGSFRCSDERLNQIWMTGAYTVHLCMQDYLWDGIKRDRLVWIGDMHPETMTILSVFGGHDIVPASLDLIRQRTPLPSWMNGISSYSMWWLLIQYDWYRYQGDQEFLVKNKEYILALLDQLVLFIGPDNQEILPEGRFLDWPSSANPAAIHAGLQALLTLSLKVGSELCGIWGESDLAAKYARAEERLRQYHPDPNNSKQAAALMALASLADPKKLNEQVMAVGGASGMSTFYGYYVLQARALAGDYQGCLDAIRDYWGGMLDLGATTFWEDFDLSWTQNATRIDELPQPGKKDIHGDFGNYCYLGFRHSLCHGWASGPTAWLSEHVLGIRPLAPGFSKVKIAPQLADLAWAEGTFPTPLGIIKVRHEKQADGTIRSEIQLPKGMVRER